MKINNYDQLLEIAMNNFADAVRTGPPTLIDRAAEELRDAGLIGRWTPANIPRKKKTYDDCVTDVTRTYEAINGIYPQNAERQTMAQGMKTETVVEKAEPSPLRQDFYKEEYARIDNENTSLRNNLREAERHSIRLAEDIVAKSSKIIDLEDKLNGAQQRIDDLVQNVRTMVNLGLKLLNAG